MTHSHPWQPSEIGVADFDNAPAAATEAALPDAERPPSTDTGPVPHWMSTLSQAHSAWRLGGRGSALTPSMVVALQRSAGNAAVVRGLGNAAVARTAAKRASAPSVERKAVSTEGRPKQQDRRVLQRTFAGSLEHVNLQGFQQQLKEAGAQLKYPEVRDLYERAKKSEKKLKTIGDVISEFGISTSTAPESIPSKTGSASTSPEKAPSDSAREIPAETLSQIASVSDEAQAEAVAEAKDVKKRQGKEKQGADKKHTPVKPGSGLIINNVWLGSNPLGPLEKFNLYSWRALGHSVNIYTYPFGSDPPRTEADLGLDAGDATIIHLGKLLEGDDSASVGSAKALLGDARSILKRWLKAIPAQRKPSIEHIYNMVDLTKSYIGGTQRGIVLDMKVGPSVHLQDYMDSFTHKLISYTRGRNTAGGLPENQSIGTMQETDDLRKLYAEKFNSKVKALANESHDKPWFNELTGYHSRSYDQTRKWLDVATKSPSGTEATGTAYEVSEPGARSRGPFRVFKHAGDQSNRAGQKPSPSIVRNLAQDVWEGELSVSGGDDKFLLKAKAAMELLPSA